MDTIDKCHDTLDDMREEHSDVAKVSRALSNIRSDYMRNYSSQKESLVKIPLAQAEDYHKASAQRYIEILSIMRTLDDIDVKIKTFDLEVERSKDTDEDSTSDEETDEDSTSEEETDEEDSAMD
jgi:hypothetical protein